MFRRNVEDFRGRGGMPKVHAQETLQQGDKEAPFARTEKTIGEARS